MIAAEGLTPQDALRQDRRMIIDDRPILTRHELKHVLRLGVVDANVLDR